MKILLVAKPWKGGLPYYVLKTLEEIFPGQVEYLPVYPTTVAERVRYLRDKGAWRNEIADKINAGKHDVAIVLHHLREFRALTSKASNLLWLIDGPRLERSDLAPYGKVYISDMGYAEALALCAPSGLNIRELPFACVPSVHSPCQPRSTPRGACFIGNKDPKRDAYLEWMHSHECAPNVYGNYFFRHPLFWKHPTYFRPSIPLSGMGRIYSEYSVSINIHAQVVRHGTNMRTFECASYGIPQLVEYRPGLDRYFEPEKEILTFSSPAQCVDQLERLLGDAKLRRYMSVLARQRALSEHTYLHRMRELLNEVI